MADDNFLKLNPQKCEVVVFDQAKQNVDDCGYKLNGVALATGSEVLGLLVLR